MDSDTLMDTLAELDDAFHDEWGFLIALLSYAGFLAVGLNEKERATEILQKAISRAQQQTKS